MQKKSIITVLLLFSLFFSFSLSAQNLDQFRGRLQKKQNNSAQKVLRDKFNKAPKNLPAPPLSAPEYRTCATMEVASELRARFPQMRSLDEEEVILQKQIAEYQSQIRFRGDTDEIIRIPVIVHVIHNGEAVGEGSNISRAQIQSQIDVLNEDYRRAGDGANDHPAGADIEIEFVLAVEDPKGVPLSEPGINRIHGGRSFWEVSSAETVLKPQTFWDPNRYMNMWTVQFGGANSNLLGYAQFPSASELPGFEQNEGPAKTDGVVIGFNYFGRIGNLTPPYNGGRTATHEVGHWLGLRHIWGDGDCSADDFCADTPPAAYSNRSCVVNDSCEDGPDKDMIENYMDYTPDACMNIFTNDQKTRMHTVLQNSPRRKELISSSVATGGGNPEGSPVAQFSANRTGACVGQTVRFTDLSTNNPTNREWRFYDGAGNLLATFNNPVQDINFTTPGLYSVELVVANEAGQDSYLEENFISIVSDELYQELNEDFEDPANLLNDWILFNPDADRTFSLSQVSSYGEGGGSIVFDNYSLDDDPSGTVDALISPAFDLSSLVNPYFYFEHAYAPFDSEFSDTLVMFFSVDCGETFEPFWFKGGTELATTLPSEESFVPTAEEWAWNQVSLAPLSGHSSVHILIANLSGWGNNLYLDNISFFDGLDYTEDAVEADFWTAKTKICEGDLIQFQDYSSNYPSEWAWQFEGGAPATSSAQHPFVLYNTPGTFDVGFQSANLFGADGFTISGLIEVVPLPQVTLRADRAQVCAGESVLLTAGGASSYEWYDERSNSFIHQGESLLLTLYQSVTFTIVGFNELGCENEATFRLEVSPAPAEPVITLSGEELVSTPAFAYQWYVNGEPISAQNGGRQQAIAPQVSGLYEVEVFNADGCSAVSEPFDALVSGLSDLRVDLSPSLKVFPNPAYGRIRLEMDNDAQGNFQVDIISLAGQTMQRFNWEKHAGALSRQIDISQMPAGMYMLALTNDSYRAVKKFVKQ